MSQRVLIVGTSESGKSTLAKRLLEGADVPVFVHDPLFTDWPNLTARFNTSDELRALMEKIKGEPFICVVDEAGDFFRVGQTENHWIFTRGRHAAMLPIAIAQRVKMIAPNVREQASDLFVFNSGRESAEILAEEYNQPDLAGACNLAQGEFFHCRWKDGKKSLTKHKLW